MSRAVRNVFTGHKIAKSIFADIDKLTLILHSIKLIATKTGLPELELSSMSIIQVKQLRVPVAMGVN